MIDIDAETAVRLLHDVVQERGADFVYKPSGDEGNGCSYVHENEDGDPMPGCGVGLALINAGVPIGAFNELDINFGYGAWAALQRLKTAGHVDFTINAAHILERFQARQDDEVKYSESLAAALKLL